jgi:hypothetical protein
MAQEWSNDGPEMAFKVTPKRAQDDPKVTPRCAKVTQDCLEMISRRLQDGPKDSLRWLENCPKLAQDGTNMAPAVRNYDRDRWLVSALEFGRTRFGDDFHNGEAQIIHLDGLYRCSQSVWMGGVRPSSNLGCIIR